jgi:ribose-phosphate pyrophosphokinase
MIIVTTDKHPFRDGWQSLLWQLARREPFSHLVDVQYSQWGAGEENVRVGQMQHIGHNHTEVHIVVTGRVTSDDIVRLCLLNAAVQARMGGRARLQLWLAYLPYSRQDRPEPAAGVGMNSLVLLHMLNSVRWAGIHTLDVHSSVLEGRVDSYPQHEVMVALGGAVREEIGAIVAPDMGAVKKAEKLADALDVPLLVCHKRRLGTAGVQVKLLGTTCDRSVSADTPIMIVDDICDGGRTFLGVSEELKLAGYEDQQLMVSHACSASGVERVLNGSLIRRVHAAHSLFTQGNNIFVTWSCGSAVL